MFLSHPDIIRYLKRKHQGLRFEPEVTEDRIAQVSIDLLLGRLFTAFKTKEKLDYLDSIHMDPSLWESVDIWETTNDDHFVLQPNQFVLAQTLERISMPNSLMGFVEGRSSYARIGVTVHVTAPKIDPGFNGHITLEMANFGQLPVKLRAGVDKPAQLLLAQISKPLKMSELYGTDPTDLFQNQKSPIPRKRKS